MTAVHRCARNTSAEPQRVLDVARATLAAAGFRVGPVAGGLLTAEGPGMTSTKQAPLRFASRIRLEVGEGRLALEAELGGLRTIMLFVWIFPPLLGLLLLAGFALAFRGEDVSRGALLSPLLAVAPWVFLAPLMSYLFKRRARQTVESLADTLAAS